MVRPAMLPVHKTHMPGLLSATTDIQISSPERSSKKARIPSSLISSREAGIGMVVNFCCGTVFGSLQSFTTTEATRFFGGGFVPLLNVFSRFGSAHGEMFYLSFSFAASTAASASSSVEKQPMPRCVFVSIES